MTEALERATNLPCWQGKVSPVPLPGGLSNHNFVVEDGGRKYVCRIGADQPMHNVLRFNEQNVGRAAQDVGITPRQVYTEPDVLVMDFVEGKTFEPEDVATHIERVAAQIKHLHVAGTRAVRGAVLGFSVFHVHRHYAKLLQEADSRVADTLPELLDLSATLESAVGPIELALGHNDLLAANFIDDGEKIWIIDWEHAGFSTPLFDLANIASNSVLGEEDESRMLTAYYGHPPDGALWRRYRALRTASHLRETMWSMIAEIYSEIDEDYVAYTAKNLGDFEASYEVFKAL